MLAFLSDEWVAAMDEALSGHPVADAVTGDGSLVVRQVVTGAPTGARSYTLWFDGGRAGVEPRSTRPADVTFTSDWDTAVAIASGKERAQVAFLSGRLRLGGDSRVLLDRAAALADLDDVFAAVRARTDFGA